MRAVLIVDAAINFVLGVLLLLFSPEIVAWLGMPPSPASFYPNILGAIFIGITIALVVGAGRSESARQGGLGLVGAVAINLCGGTVLALWLIFGGLDIPARGYVLLWTLVAVLVVVSLVELVRFRWAGRRDPRR